MKRYQYSFFSSSLIIFLIFINLYNHHSIYPTSQVIADIEPNCGLLKDHRINMTVNGFNKNGNVYWEFINSKGMIDYYGYFDTNSTGGFNDYTIADGLLPNIYILRFFDDKNNDYVKDPNGLEINFTYAVPCNG